MKIDEFLKKLNRAVELAKEEVLGEAALKAIGEKLAEEIKVRTRLGYGVSENGGSKTKLKDLSDDYKKQRKQLKKSGELSTETTPNKSNLTQTGDMLNNIGVEVRSGKLFVFIKGDYNQEKAQWVSEDRPFFHLTDIQIKSLKRDIEAKLIKSIRNNLK